MRIELGDTHDQAKIRKGRATKGTKEANKPCGETVAMKEHHLRNISDPSKRSIDSE